MEHFNSYKQKVYSPNRNDTPCSSQETLKNTLDEWIKCQKELTALNKKLLSLCKSDTKLHWLQARGFLNFPVD
jgi:hypothetical protein